MMLKKSYTFKAKSQGSENLNHFGVFEVYFYTTPRNAYIYLANYLDNKDEYDWSITDLRRIK